MSDPIGTPSPEDERWFYCTHCSFMNELLPVRWYGVPLYPSDPPGDFDRDPCTWYWYRDPGRIPERHWTRYGLARPVPSPPQ